MDITNLSGIGNGTNFSEIANKTLTTGNWIADVIINAPAEISSKISTLITILQIAGIVVIGYVVFLIIRALLRWRRNIKIGRTYELVTEINDKLDILLKDHEEYKKLLIKQEKNAQKAESMPLKKGFLQRFFEWKNKNKKSKETVEKGKIPENEKKNLELKSKKASSEKSEKTSKN